MLLNVCCYLYKPQDSFTFHKIGSEDTYHQFKIVYFFKEPFATAAFESDAGPDISTLIQFRVLRKLKLAYVDQ